MAQVPTNRAVGTGDPPGDVNELARIHNKIESPIDSAAAGQSIRRALSGSAWEAFTPGTGGATVRVEDEGGTIITAASGLNFAGAGVTVTDAGANEALVTIPGGGSGITVQDEGSPLATIGTTLNFTGAGVSASGTGATKTINIPGAVSSGETTADETLIWMGF